MIDLDSEVDCSVSADRIVRVWGDRLYPIYRTHFSRHRVTMLPSNLDQNPINSQLQLYRDRRVESG